MEKIMSKRVGLLVIGMAIALALAIVPTSVAVNPVDDDGNKLQSENVFTFNASFDNWRIDTQREWESVKGVCDNVRIENGVLHFEENGYFRTRVRNYLNCRSAVSLSLSSGPAWDNWNPQGQITSHGHNPVLFIEPERSPPYRMLRIVWKPTVHTNLYASSDMVNWSLVKENVVPDEANTGRIGPNGKYYVYTGTAAENNPVTDLWLGDKLVSLEDRGTVVEEGDPGVYYDPIENKWHLYTERGFVSGEPCTWKIGHWVSEDGENDWVKENAVVDLHGTDCHTGDPEIIRIDGRYHLFIDNAYPPKHHPYYNILHYVSDNLYSGFERVGKRNGNVLMSEDFGRSGGDGDACVRYAENKFWMFFETSGNNWQGQTWYMTSPGPWEGSLDARVGVDNTGDGLIDSWTPWQEMEEEYSALDLGSKDKIKTEASLDLSGLENGYGFELELRGDYSDIDYLNIGLENAEATLSPAKFELSNLSVSKPEIEPGESTTVSIQVTNTGGKSGSRAVEVEIGGQIRTGEVTLDPGESDTVTFDVTENEVGTYEVSAGGMTGSFEVVKPEEGKPKGGGGGIPLLPVAGAIIAIVAVAGGVWLWRKS